MGVGFWFTLSGAVLGSCTTPHRIGRVSLQIRFTELGDPPKEPTEHGTKGNCMFQGISLRNPFSDSNKGTNFFLSILLGEPSKGVRKGTGKPSNSQLGGRKTPPQQVGLAGSETAKKKEANIRPKLQRFKPKDPVTARKKREVLGAPNLGAE